MSAYFSAMGKIGGLIGGRQRAKNLSKKRRTEIARMGANARLVNARWRKMLKEMPLPEKDE